MQAVGIFAEVFAVGRAAVAGGVVVADHPAKSIEVGVMKVLHGIAARIGEGMPRPLRKGAERDGLVERLGEGLEAGDIGGEGEIAVADGKGVVGIEGMQDGVVPGDKRVAVDGRKGLRGRGEQRQGRRGPRGLKMPGFMEGE